MCDRDEIVEVMQRHADDVLRACSIYLRVQADREDAFQETFLRFARSDVEFSSDEHRKAWLIRVAINVCKDMLKSAQAKVESLDDLEESGVALVNDDGREVERSLEVNDVRNLLTRLEEKYRVVLYLKYYLDYSAAEISEFTGMPVNTVYTNLARGKRVLRGMMDHD